MQRRTLAALALVVAVAAVGAGLADPLASRPAREPVALDAPPATAVQDALRQAATGDYTLRIAPGGPNGTGDPFTVARVENSEREVLIRSLGPGPTRLTYANAHVGWTGRPGHLDRGAGEWDDRHTPFTRVDNLSNPGENTSVERVGGTESAVVYRVSGPLAFHLVGRESAEDERATLTVVVDRSTRTLGRARFVRAPANESAGERHVTVYEFSAWGGTEVRRPPGAGYSLAEFLFDAAS